MTPYTWGMLAAIGAALGVFVWMLIRGGSRWRPPRWKGMVFCAGAATVMSLVDLMEPNRQTRDLALLISGIVLMLIAVFVIKPRDERAS